MTSRDDPKHSEIELLEEDQLLGTEPEETTELSSSIHNRYSRGWILTCALLIISCTILAIQNIQLHGVAKCPSTFSTDLRMLFSIFLLIQFLLNKF